MGKNAEQLKGHGAEHCVHSVSDSVSQSVKRRKCQHPAYFTVITLIRKKSRGRPVSTSHSASVKHACSSFLQNPKQQFA